MTTAVATATTDEPFQLFSTLLYSRALLSQPENTRLCGSPCPFYMLVYHRDRILAAARNFGWQDVVTALEASGFMPLLIEKCQRAVDDAAVKIATDDGGANADDIEFRLRLLVSDAAAITVEAYPLPSMTATALFPSTLPPPSTALTTSQNPPWTVHLDRIPMSPSSLTRYKTTARNHYLAARTRVGIHTFTEPSEVILYSDSADQLIMEGSITNIYFWRPERGGWITPTTSAEDAAGNGAGGTAGTMRRWVLEHGMATVGDVRKGDVVAGEVVWLSNGLRGVVLGRIAETTV
ncbi:hypothetical protein Dda_2734 [Drechslerella dactyloides]|uniref:Aminodeoxychorismate lyase n=1 Tax=Drechslerella dactyloides TaxID=74499 RepID=A0AAD6J051_DREDA|nr:hypothetical protein Dda_2734 [Drechslerella dactyloides]